MTQDIEIFRALTTEEKLKVLKDMDDEFREEEDDIFWTWLAEGIPDEEAWNDEMMLEDIEYWEEWFDLGMELLKIRRRRND